MPEHQNVPTRARSGVRDRGNGEERRPSTRTCPCGHVLVFEMRDIGGDMPEHQNAPTRARSGVWDVGNVFGGWGTALVRGEGEGACPTAKTHPSGRVFGIQCDIEGEGRCPTAQACYCGRVCDVRHLRGGSKSKKHIQGTCFLGLERLGTHRTQKMRPTARFSCSAARRGETWVGH